MTAENSKHKEETVDRLRETTKRITKGYQTITQETHETAKQDALQYARELLESFDQDLAKEEGYPDLIKITKTTQGYEEWEEAVRMAEEGEWTYMQNRLVRSGRSSLVQSGRDEWWHKNIHSSLKFGIAFINLAASIDI